MMTLENRLGYRFADSRLALKALTHKSYHNENPEDSEGHNEVLEFLGDAVLDLVLAERLMQVFPDLPEGDLSKLRASLVNEAVLAELFSELDLKDHLRMGRGEKLAGGQTKPRLSASALEALVGAIYQDGGFEKAREFSQRLFERKIQEVDVTNLYQSDYKTRLQEIIQEKKRLTPTYEILKEEGPDHDKVFYVRVSVADVPMAEGKGKSKKQAEQDAARQALELLK